MHRSILWLVWLVLPVFVLAYHYGPGQSRLARDHAATLVAEAESQSTAADAAQVTAYETQFRLIEAQRTAFAAGVDWQTQPQHHHAKLVSAAVADQATAYEKAAEIWQQAADSYGQAIQTLLKAADQPGNHRGELSQRDRQLLESLRWAEARAMVRSGEVFNGIGQLQALLDFATVESANQKNTQKLVEVGNPAGTSASLPTDVIREELAAAQYIGARLLREEGRPQEIWRPVANSARQHYRYLSAAGNDPTVVDIDKTPVESPDRDERFQRNLEQVLNLEQIPSEELQGRPLPRRAPLARRPGDGQPGDGKGKGKKPGRGPLKDGPPAKGAAVPGPTGVGW